MAYEDTIRLYRGNKSGLPTVLDGEPVWAHDTGELYVGGRYGNVPIGYGIRPEAYGAKGDGTTDDSVAVQAAADAVNTAGGGVILFGPKTYICNFTVGDHTTLRGSGIRKTILKARAGSNAAVVQGKNFATLTGKAYAVGDTARGDNSVCIFDLTIDGNKDNQTTAGYGIRLWGCNYHWQNLFVQNCKEGGIWTEFTTIDGNSLDDLLESLFINIKVAHNDGDGWVFNGPHDSILAHFDTVANGGWGLTTGSSSSIKGSHWNSWNNTTGSYYIAECASVSHIVASGPDGIGIETAAITGSCKFTGATIGGHETGLILRGSSHMYQGQILTCSYPGYGTGNGDAIVLDGAIGCVIDVDVSDCDNFVRIVSEGGRNIIKGVVSIATGDTLFDPSMPTSDYINLVTIGSGATQSQWVNFPEGDIFTIGGYTPSFPADNGAIITDGTLTGMSPSFTNLTVTGTETVKDLSVQNNAAVVTEYIKSGSGTSTHYPRLLMYRSRNTLESPTDVQAGDWLGLVGAVANKNSAERTAAYMSFNCVGVDTNIVSSDIRFNTTNAAGTDATRITISGEGKVGINDPSPAEILDVDGNINATGVVKIDDVQVIGPQAAAEADAKEDYTTGDLDSEAEVIAAINATNTTLNNLLAKLRTHGLLDT
jgi:hypothetical protein